MGKPSPRFRQDLVVSSVEEDGVAYADVSDPGTGTKFRFYDFEYQLATQLNGQPVDDVVSWAATAYGAELTAEGIDEFAGRLAELGFLETKPQPAADASEITDQGPPLPSEITDQGSVDSAEAEWMSPQGAQTAQFTPDFAMLASPDRTPVAPELPILEALAASERTPGPRPTESPAARSSLPGGGLTPPPSPVPPSPSAAPLPSLFAAAVAPAPPAPAPKPPAVTLTPAAPVSVAVTPTPPVSVAVTTMAAPPVSVAVTRPKDAPTVRLPPEARVVTRPMDAPPIALLASTIEGGGAGSAKPAASGEEPPTPVPVPTFPAASAGTARSWASALEGTLDGKPGDATPPPRQLENAPGPSSLPPPQPPNATRAVAAPPGVAERRQPPTPETVSMSGFDQATAQPARSQRRPMIIAAVLLVVLTVAVVSFLAWRGSARTPQALRVRVLSPKPSAEYRWFTGRGVVTEEPAKTLAFDAPGRIAELWPPGTEFGAKEVVGRLQAAAGMETLLAHHRSRLAFYEQMRDSMRSAGNVPETRQAEIKLADKQRLVDDANAGLVRVVLRPSEPGEVLEALAKVGTLVKPGTPVMRVKGRLLRGAFELASDERSAADKLGLCRVEVVGLGPRASNADHRRATEIVSDSGSPEAQNVPRFIDCKPPAAPADKARGLTVGLPGDVGLVPGQPLRLARQRFDAVFPVPADAITTDGDVHTIWIATPAGLVEKRTVVVADTGEEPGGEALISEGLRVGESIVLEAPPTLQPGTRIVAERW